MPTDTGLDTSQPHGYGDYLLHAGLNLAGAGLGTAGNAIQSAFDPNTYQQLVDTLNQSAQAQADQLEQTNQEYDATNDPSVLKKQGQQLYEAAHTGLDSAGQNLFNTAYNVPGMVQNAAAGKTVTQQQPYFAPGWTAAHEAALTDSHPEMAWDLSDLGRHKAQLQLQNDPHFQALAAHYAQSAQSNPVATGLGANPALAIAPLEGLVATGAVAGKQLTAEQLALMAARGGAQSGALNVAASPINSIPDAGTKFGQGFGPGAVASTGGMAAGMVGKGIQDSAMAGHIQATSADLAGRPVTASNFANMQSANPVVTPDEMQLHGEVSANDLPTMSDYLSGNEAPEVGTSEDPKLM